MVSPPTLTLYHAHLILMNITFLNELLPTVSQDFYSIIENLQKLPRLPNSVAHLSIQYGPCFQTNFYGFIEFHK